LAKISADVLLTLRGSENRRVQFYSWVWASGSHGGPRLFSPSPGAVRILFLEEKAGYLHTVGDYPAYDLVVRSRSLPEFLSDWNGGYARAGSLVERLVAILLKADFESSKADGSDSYLNTWELAELTSHSFITGRLDSLCHLLTNPAGRTRACAEFAQALREESFRPR
jgi:hypothetical protein